jgi:hypothetical protein
MSPSTIARARGVHVLKFIPSPNEAVPDVLEFGQSGYEV